MPNTAVSSAQALAEENTNRRITWIITLHATTDRLMVQRTSSKYLSILESNSIPLFQAEAFHGRETDPLPLTGVTRSFGGPARTASDRAIGLVDRFAACFPAHQTGGAAFPRPAFQTASSQGTPRWSRMHPPQP